MGDPGARLELSLSREFPHSYAQQELNNAKNEIQVLKPAPSTDHTNLNKEPDDEGEAKEQTRESCDPVHSKTQYSRHDIPDAVYQ